MTRYVDVTITKVHMGIVDKFTNFFDSRDQHMQFTVDPEEVNQLPIFYICINLNKDEGLTITEYLKKHTH